MRGFKHREAKGYNYSNKQMAADFGARLTIGNTTNGEPHKLAHTSAATARRRQRRQFRREASCGTHHGRTIVSYGDASLKSSYKGHTPVPVKVFYFVLTRSLSQLTSHIRAFNGQSPSWRLSCPWTSSALLKLVLSVMVN